MRTPASRRLVPHLRLRARGLRPDGPLPHLPHLRPQLPPPVPALVQRWKVRTISARRASAEPPPAAAAARRARPGLPPPFRRLVMMAHWVLAHTGASTPAGHSVSSSGGTRMLRAVPESGRLPRARARAPTRLSARLSACHRPWLSTRSLAAPRQLAVRPPAARPAVHLPPARPSAREHIARRCAHWLLSPPAPPTLTHPTAPPFLQDTDWALRRAGLPGVALTLTSSSEFEVDQFQRVGF